MIKRIFEKSKNLIYSQECAILCIGAIVGFVVSFAKIGGDDALYFKKINTTIGACWDWAIGAYYTWSSRQLVNFIWAVVLEKGRVALFIYMTVSMYVLLKAMILLWVKKDNGCSLLYIVGTIMLMPWGALSTAGWIATLTTYFGPQAFALMALVPIKKVLNEEKISCWEIILYAICLVYSANTEQMCVVILALYIIAAIYLLVVRKFNWIICLQLVLSVGSMIYMMTCPGNWNRAVSEEMTWFPTYGMLGIIDKADIGLSTTLKWMFADGNFFIIILCALMAVFVWKKYENLFFRVVALIPAVIVALLGLFQDKVSKVLPYVAYLANDVDYYGAFNVANHGSGSGALQFCVFLILVGCICVEIILLNEKVEGLIADISLAAVGVASRCMMGFSPTVYASSTRTYTPLIFCLMAISVHIFESNVYLIAENDCKIGIIKCIMWIFLILGFINLMFCIGTTFY